MCSPISPPICLRSSEIWLHGLDPTIAGSSTGKDRRDTALFARTPRQPAAAARNQSRTRPWPLLTASRPENELAGNERERTGTRRNESAVGEVKALVERRVRFPAAPQEKKLVKAKSLGQLSFSSTFHQHPWSLAQAWVVIGDWKHDYNHYRYLVLLVEISWSNPRSRGTPADPTRRRPPTPCRGRRRRHPGRSDWPRRR
jgi:hypothetical protein